MDGSDEEIARLFEAELRDLDNFPDESDDEEFGMKDLEGLGRELRQSLKNQDKPEVESNDDEWNELLASRQLQSDHLQCIQQMDTTAGAGAGPLVDIFYPQDLINHDLLLQSFKSPANDSSGVDPVIHDLMDSMLSSLEFKDSLTAPPASASQALLQRSREKVEPVDLSSLPQLLVGEDEFKANFTFTPGKANLALTGYSALSLAQFPIESPRTLEQQRQRQMQEALEMVALAEQKLLAEEAEANAALEADRQERLARKQRMVEGMVRAKRAKASIRIQSCIRRISAKAKRRRMIMEAVVEQARLAEEVKKQKELEFLLQEATREGAECELMRDADLEMFALLNAENNWKEKEILLLEEENRLLEREEAMSRDLRNSPSQALKWESELQHKADIQAIEDAHVQEVQQNIAHTQQVWGHFNPIKAFKVEEEPEPETGLRRSPSQNIILEEMNSVWGHFSHLHPVDKIYGEFGIFNFNLDKYNPEKKEKKKKKKKRRKGAAEGGEEEPEGSEEYWNVYGNRGSAGTFDDKVCAPEGRRYAKNYSDAESREIREKVLTKGVITDAMRQEWMDLAHAAVSASVSDVSFESNTPDISYTILQKRVPLAFVHTQLEQPESAMPISPRAKLGIRVVSARNISPPTIGSSGKTRHSDALSELVSEPLDEQPEARNQSNQEVAANSKHVLKNERLCPVFAALICWQKSLSKTSATNTANRITLLESDPDIDQERLDLDNIMMHAGFEKSQLKHDDEDNHAGLPEKMTSIDDSEGEEDRGPAVVTAEDIEAHDEILENLGLRGDPSNIANLELGVEALKSATFLQRFVNLKRLQLNVNKLISLDGLQPLDKLEDLQVKDNSLADISALKKCYALKALHLDANQLTSISALKGLNELTTLSVNANKLTTLQSLTRCHKLQKLLLYQNQINGISVDSLKHLSSLTHLDLGRNKLEHISGEALSQCSLLQTLVLSQNKMLSVPTPLRLPQLKTLWLSGNLLENLSGWCPVLSHEMETKVAPAPAPARADLALSDFEWPLFCPMLEKLHLQDNRLQCLNSTAMLVFPHVTLLDVSFNNIATVENIHGIALCPRLAALHIQENPVSVQPATSGALLAWIQETCIRMHTVSGEDITDQWAKRESDIVAQATTRSVLHCYQSTDEWTRSRAENPIRHKINCEVIRVLRESMGVHILSDVTSSPSTTRSSELLQLLHSIGVEQNVLSANQKVQRRAQERKALADMSKVGGKDTNSTPDVSVSLDDQFVGLLTKHLKMMRNWDSKEAISTEPYLVSYAWTKRPNTITTNRNKGKNRCQIRIRAASVIQALFRGNRGRKHVKKAIAGAKYADQELDDMFMGMDEADLDLAELHNAPELHANYFSHAGAKTRSAQSMGDIYQYGYEQRSKQAPHGQYQEQNYDVGNDADAQSAMASFSSPQSTARGSKPMVYGDHRRRAQQQDSRQPVSQGGNEVDMFLQSQDNRPLQIASWVDNGSLLPPLTHQQAAQLASGEQFTPSSPFGASPRPMSAMTDSSEIFSDSGRDRIPMNDDDDFFDMYQGSFHNNSGPKDTRSQALRVAQSKKSTDAANLIAQEWGISDPKVLAMMVKRSKTIKNGAPASGGGGGGTRSSAGTGSFGGKPKVIRGSNKSIGRKGTMPAWAKPGDEN